MENGDPLVAEKIRSEFENLHIDIEEDRSNRRQQHFLAVKKLGIKRRKRGSGQLNILAEGDSWFYYIPLHPDIIDHLEGMGSPHPLILNYAHYGDAAEQILSLPQRQRIIEALSNPSDYGKFDALLFSAGGNDLAGDQFCLWLKERNPGFPDPSNGIDLQRLASIEGVVKAALEDLIEIRNDTQPDCKIFLHSYDYAIPKNKGVCGVGPWMYPSFIYRKWTSSPDQIAIVKKMLQTLEILLIQLAQTYNNVVYVKTLGTLLKTDWANELHPTTPGFQKLANVFLTSLRTEFPGRI